MSDPFYIDIANYTDFYRLRASLTDVDTKNPRMRRYDWPSAHAPAPIDQSGGSARGSRCNGGVPVDLNPIPHSAYLRAVTLELEHELDVPSARQAPKLPPTTLFTLDPDPALSRMPNFNPLPGVRLFLPLIDENAQPLGGVRFPDVEHPVGRPFLFRCRPSRRLRSTQHAEIWADGSSSRRKSLRSDTAARRIT